MKLESNYASTGETVLEFIDIRLQHPVQISPPLLISGHVQQLTGDRIAAAAALLLGSRMTRVLEMNRSISEHFGLALAEFMADPGFSTQTEASTGHARSGGNTLVITDDPKLDRPRQSHATGRRVWFTQLSLDRSTGRLFTFDSVVVSTNAHFIAVSDLGGSLAVPVLMAHELGVSTIEAPPGTAARVGRDSFDATADLLAATQLQLTEGKEVRS